MANKQLSTEIGLAVSSFFVFFASLVTLVYVKNVNKRKECDQIDTGRRTFVQIVQIVLSIVSGTVMGIALYLVAGSLIKGDLPYAPEIRKFLAVPESLSARARRFVQSVRNV